MKRKSVDKHTTECHICYEMEARGYDDESMYWDDFFAKKEKEYQFKLYFKNKLVAIPDLIEE